MGEARRPAYLTDAHRRSCRAAARDRRHDQPDGQAPADAQLVSLGRRAVWVSTLGWTVKVKNAKRDPRVTLCIDGPSRRTNYVQVFGTAEVVEGDVRERTLDLIRKYEPSRRTPRSTGRISRKVASSSW